MRLKNEQYEEIKQAVIDTFIEYDIKCIPINAFEMAVKMGLIVIPYSALAKEQLESSQKFSKDGFSMEMTNSDWKIYYNDMCQNYGRINQTIMHEIGHYVLGHIKEGKEEEAEAKFFAKYALAPPPLVHNICEEVNPFIIMNKFEISYEAARYACDYYHNWIEFGEPDYTKYERKMLELFNVA